MTDHSAVTDERERETVIEHFRSRINAIVEEHQTGPELVDALVSLVGAREDQHGSRERAQKASLENCMADLRWKDCMLGQIGNIAGRQIVMTAAKMAEIERHRSVETVLTDLAEDLRVSDPELARRLTDVLAVPAASGRAMRPVTLAFAPDSRWSTGWFMRAGQSVPQALPFAGWMLVARPDRPEQRVEAAFLCHGHACSLTELQNLGFAYRGHS